MMKHGGASNKILTARKILLGFVVISFIFLALDVPAHANATSSDCRENADTFLATPNASSVVAVSGVNEQMCWPVIGLSNANLDRLIHSVEKGNRWAAQYLAVHLGNLDGGNLEDSLIALGQFADHHMERLLDFAKQGQISDHELKDALTMLPLSLSDKPDAQLNVLKARRLRVIKVTRADLGKQRVAALKVLDDFALEIRANAQQTRGENVK